MKTTSYIIVLLLSFFLISCNRREKQLERRLVATEHSLNESNVELLKALQGVQNLIEENENLKNEIDDLKSKNEKLIKRNNDLAVENNDLRNENDNLSNKHNAKVASGKIQVKPTAFTPKTVKEHSRNNNITENKKNTITNNEIKSFLTECKKSVKEINNLLSYLRNVDEERVNTKLWRGFKQTRQYKRSQQKYSRDSRRQSACLQIGNEATKLHYKITRKLKNLPEDNSTIQFRKILLSIDQNLKIIIYNNNVHKQATTKGEWDTCTTSALQALERINGIIDNF